MPVCVCARAYVCVYVCVCVRVCRSVRRCVYVCVSVRMCVGVFGPVYLSHVLLLPLMFVCMYFRVREFAVVDAFFICSSGCWAVYHVKG